MFYTLDSAVNKSLKSVYLIIIEVLSSVENLSFPSLLSWATSELELRAPLGTQLAPQGSSPSEATPPPASPPRNSVSEGNVCRCLKTTAHRTQGCLHGHAALCPDPRQGLLTLSFAQNTWKRRQDHPKWSCNQRSKAGAGSPAGLLLTLEKKAGPELSRVAHGIPKLSGEEIF